MDHFFEKIAEILEVDVVNGSDVLADFPEWDSLSVLSVIVMADSDYHVNLTADEVRDSRTGQGLLDLVARKDFEVTREERVEPLINQSVSKLWDLSGRHFIVSGASSGIGRAVARLFDSLGARMTLVDLDRAGLEETAAQCARNDHLLVEFDLRRLEEIDMLVKAAVAGAGTIYGFVHCAGIQRVMPARVLTVAAWREIFAVNTESGLAVAKSFCSKRIHADSGGSIVFISSVMGLVGSPAATAYSMSKSALHGVARSLAIEFAAKRIRVNCIAPGFVRTPMFERGKGLWDDAQRAAVEAQHPLGIGSAEDVANAVAFLCADTGRWITGSILVVDGGYLAQ